MKKSALEVLVSVFARTDTGLQRPGNEDAFMVADLTSGNVGLSPNVSTHPIGERGSLMMVADGMGGAAAGEIASEMAVKTVRDALISSPQGPEFCDHLTRAVEIANERIWNHAQQNRELRGMGATLTAVLVRSRHAYIAQVGDSRAYLARGSQIKQLTKDQSWAQALIDAGAIQPDQASSVAQNLIMQALGTSPTVQVAMTMVELCRNDHLILCSDGLSNKISADEIRDIAQQEENLASACSRLIALANERGGEDNITVIVARFDGEELHSAADSNSITGSFKVLDQGCLGGDLSTLSDKFKALAISREESVAGSRTLVLNRLEAEAGAGACSLASRDRVPPEPPRRPDASSRPAAGSRTEQAPNRREQSSVKPVNYLGLGLAILAGLLVLAAASYFLFSLILRAGR
jgi:serine/threonine protein phosphatase PrpC